MTPGAVTGTPRLIVRLEGLAAFALATWLFARGGHSWPLFAILFLVPDVSFAAYAMGPRLGALGYNLLHSYVGPIVLGALFVATGRPPVLALVWAAHVGFDRMLGYGLKYPTAFGDTHLGRIGRQ
jgi:hypothetical protein